VVQIHLAKKAANNQVMIEYFDSLEESDKKLVPLIICPGLSETAEEYLDLLEAVLPRRSIILSFRGRGKSDTPDRGYNLTEHVSDIEAVVKQTGISPFHLFSYSRGVSYALGYVERHKEQIQSLIIGDYPPEHRAMPHDWPEDYINNYLIPYNRTANIRPEAVWGIQRESALINLDYMSLSMPVLVGRGKLQESLITDTDLDRYKKMCSNITVKEYFQSGHNLKGPEKKLFYTDVTDFLDILSE